MIHAPVVITGPGREGSGVLLIGTQERCELPLVTLPDRWPPEMIETASRALTHSLGRDALVMRYLRLDEGVVCEGEMLDEARPLAAGMFWATSLDAAQQLATPIRDRELLQRWPARSAVAGEAGPAPWERAGWHATACAWIDECLRAEGVERSGRIAQVKGGWGESCVLQVPTAAGMRYFKAGAADAPEARVLQALARGAHGPHVPRVAAADDARNWLLLHDVGGRALDGESTAECRAAVQGFARLQIAQGRDARCWLAAGARDFRLDRLLVHYRRVIDPLPPAYAHLDPTLDRAALRAAGRRAEALSTALAAQGMPDALVNADFSPTNTRVVEGRFVYLDWADALVAQPLFALVQFLQYLHSTRTDAAAARRATDATPSDASRGGAVASDFASICEGYFDVWRQAGSTADLDSGLTLACTLNVVLLAVRWHQALLRADPHSLWASQVALARREALDRCLELRAA